MDELAGGNARQPYQCYPKKMGNKFPCPPSYLKIQFLHASVYLRSRRIPVPSR